MRKIFIIIKREYISRVRKKSFIISTLLAPLGFFAFIVFTVVMAGYSGSSKNVAVIDDSGLFADVAFPDAKDGSVVFHYSKGRTDTKAQKYDAIIQIPANYDIDNPKKININCTSEKNMGMTASTYINKVFSDKVRQVRATKLNISEEQLDNLNTEIELTYQKISEDKKKTANAMIGMGLGYVIGIAIYTLLLVYGTMIMKGVAEEKTSRIMEVLISSVKPMQLMLGKIIGIAAVGLTQFILWIMLMSASVFIIIPMIGLSAPAHPQAMPGNSAIDPDTMQQIFNAFKEFHIGPMVIVLIIFFLGGFLLYGSLFAAIGAAGGDDTDSQSLSFPIILPILITVAMMMNVLGQPEGKLAFWASLIPFSSPIIMPALMPTNPPWWQVALSMLFLFGGFLLCVLLAARIYRTGILMYGKKTTFREIGRWIFAKN